MRDDVDRVQICSIFESLRNLRYTIVRAIEDQHLDALAETCRQRFMILHARINEDDFGGIRAALSLVFHHIIDTLIESRKTTGVHHMGARLIFWVTSIMTDAQLTGVQSDKVGFHNRNTELWVRWGRDNRELVGLPGSST